MLKRVPADNMSSNGVTQFIPWSDIQKFHLDQEVKFLEKKCSKTFRAGIIYIKKIDYDRATKTAWPTVTQK